LIEVIGGKRFCAMRRIVAFSSDAGPGLLADGWRVHAFVLMSNHYHLLVETPEGNLVAGMRW
jgi:REP element-mobilizing transposase RayT